MKNDRSMKIPMISIFCFALSLTLITYGELSPESYCQVAVGIAQQQVDYLTGLAPLVEKYCEDPNFWPVYAGEPNSFLNEKSPLSKTRDEQRPALLGSFDTTAAELYIFEADNQEAISGYLAGNPAIQEAIGSLSAQIGALTSRIKVPYYCMTAVANTRLEIKNAGELTAMARQYADDMDVFLQQEQTLRKKHNAAKETLFKSFDRTTNEYLTFMSKNKEAVEQYLVNHPLIRATIDDLTGQVGPLVEEFEALRKEIVKEPETPPLPE